MSYFKNTNTVFDSKCNIFHSISMFQQMLTHLYNEKGKCVYLQYVMYIYTSYFTVR